MTVEFTPAPDAEQVTDEMIDAVVALRKYAKYSMVAGPLCEAIELLDRAGFFAPADEARTRDEELHARLIAGLRGIDLDDRYPRGDENGVIATMGADLPEFAED